MLTQIKAFARANAKAIAAAVAPYIVALIVWAARRVGYSVEIDVLSWTSTISGLIAGVIVWFTRNGPKVDQA